MPEKFLLNTDELADVLKVSPETVRTWAKRGIIPELRPSPRVRRFVLADVVDALRKRPQKEGVR